MSESTAVKRIGAARLASRFPVLFTMVARGELHLSGIHCIQAHLTLENHERALAEAKHKTMRQLEELVARLALKPDVPTTLRKLPNRSGAEPAIATPAPASPAEPAAALIAGEASTPPSPAPPPPRRDPHPTLDW